jgi:hypothetical protein
MTSNFQNKTANEGADDAQITLLGVTGFGTANTAICRFGSSSLTPPSVTSGMAPQYFNYIDDDGGSRIQILRPGIYDIEYAIGTPLDDIGQADLGVYFGSFPPGPGQPPVTTPFTAAPQLLVNSFALKNSKESQAQTVFDNTNFYYIGGFGGLTPSDDVNSGRVLLTVYSDRFTPPPTPPNSFVLPAQNQNFLWFTGSPSLAVGFSNFSVAVRFINFLDN